LIRLGVALVVVAGLLGAYVAGVAAQTPTPPATPTVTVVDGETGAFVVQPSITLGDAGVIAALIFVAVLLMLQMLLEVLAWLKR